MSFHGRGLLVSICFIPHAPVSWNKSSSFLDLSVFSSSERNMFTMCRVAVSIATMAATLPPPCPWAPPGTRTGISILCLQGRSAEQSKIEIHEREETCDKRTHRNIRKFRVSLQARAIRWMRRKLQQKWWPFLVVRFRLQLSLTQGRGG